MGSMSAVHWLLVIVVVLLVFGPSKLASVGKGLGEGIRSFKKGISEDARASDEEDEDAAEPKRLPERRDESRRPKKKVRRDRTA